MKVNYFGKVEDGDFLDLEGEEILHLLGLKNNEGDSHHLPSVPLMCSLSIYHSFCYLLLVAKQISFVWI